MKNSEQIVGSRSYLEKVEEMHKLIEECIKNGIISEDNLINLLASSWADQEFLETSHDKLHKSYIDTAAAINAFTAEAGNISSKGRMALLDLLSKSGNGSAQLLLKGIKLRAVERARRASNARHDKPGGSRDKKKQIQKIWATGKYTSRDICAEEESRALDMSFSAARRALRNTPNPKVKNRLTG